MTKHPHPSLPAPQTAQIPGTWAYKTIAERFKTTVSRVIEENQFSDEINIRLQKLRANIPQQPLRVLNDPNAPDLHHWQQIMLPYLGQNWHQPPWLITEHYFYRRILEATGYFQTGPSASVDPYSGQKQSGLAVSKQQISALLQQTGAWIASKNTTAETLQKLLYFDLWGNQADYSLWPAEGGHKPDHQNQQQALAHILVDDSRPVAQAFLRPDGGLRRVDFLLDNSGFELVCDLAVADFLLSCEITPTVRLHAKIHPTFVSDTIPQDVLDTLQFLESQPQPHVQQAAQRLQNALAANRLQVAAHWAWNTPLAGWELPRELLAELAESDFVISKGDANYRRILGDRHWDFETPFAAILAYFPAPLVALRTQKSELTCGLRPGQAAATAAQDPGWLINGRWGLVQAYFPPT